MLCLCPLLSRICNAIFVHRRSSVSDEYTFLQVFEKQECPVRRWIGE